jgi:DNA-binding transcriptional MerR regulator/methylmalonyl-CoA mutase cobalamin-binding subunit
MVPTFRLGQLTELTGVRGELLRAWEMRYGFPSASRTSGRHRRYSGEQVEAVRQAAMLIRSGFRAKEAIAMVQAQSAGSAPTPSIPVADDVDGLTDLLLEGDVTRGLAALRESWLALGFEVTLEHRVVPSLRRIGEAWAAGRASVAQEHAATGIVLSWLGAVRAELALPEGLPRFLIATPQGEDHAMGVWALELLLAQRGIPALALGANVPTTDLVAEARRRHPAGIVLAIARRGLRPVLAKVEAAVRRLPASNRPIVYVGGAGARLPLPTGVRSLPATLTAAAEQLANADRTPSHRRRG